MKPWIAALLFIALFAGLRVGASAPVLPAHEADALAAGVIAADHLTGSAGGLRERLTRGFTAGAGNPRVGMLPREHRFRHAVVDAPTATWAAALGVMLAPTSAEATNLDRAATGAALLVALALTLLALAAWRRAGARGGARWLAALTAPALLLALPGVTGAAHGAGAGAAAVLVMVLLALAVDRLVVPGGASARGARAWPVALAFGLALGLHPGAVWLIVPIFVAYAIASRRTPPPSGEPGGPPPAGELPLPVAPLGLFLIPVVGLLVLIALWPALWAETGKRLVAWMVDSFYMFNPDYEVAGVVYDQARDRAAMGWTALAQWVGFTPPPVLAAWLLGVWSIARRGRAAPWFPLLAQLTLLLVGASDGGLFGSRLTLLALLWVPTALVAAEGVAALARALERYLRGAGPARALALGAVLIGPVGLAVAGLPTSTTGQIGGELARPVPLDLLARIAAEDPDALVHIGPAPEHWRPAVDVARDHAELRVHWAELHEARWVIVAGPPQGALGDAIRDHELFWRGTHDGVSLKAFRRPRDGPPGR